MKAPSGGPWRGGAAAPPSHRSAPVAGLTENPGRRRREAALRSLAERLVPQSEIRRAAETVRAWGAEPRTPIALGGLAGEARLGAIHYQDEGPRFPVGSFKPWGGGYATERLVARRSAEPVTVTCATDGNHGQAVAWAARRAGARAVVYLAAIVSAEAERRMVELGAEVVRSTGDHEVASAVCLAAARERGWYVISETENATETRIALDTLAGYGALWEEALAPFGATPPTHLFVQAGVGGLAAVAAVVTARRFGEHRPILVVVESEKADCIRRSLEAGRRVTVEGPFDTRLAGLAAGATSLYAWLSLRAGADFALAIADAAAEDAVRRLASPVAGDPAIHAGGSGAAGLAGALAAAADRKTRSALELGRSSRVLVIGTERALEPGA